MRLKMPVSNASSFATDSDPNIHFSLGHAIDTKEIILGNSLENIVIKVYSCTKVRYLMFFFYLKPELFFLMYIVSWYINESSEFSDTEHFLYVGYISFLNCCMLNV